jgi:Protein of unknown function (DUF3592)
MPSVIFSVRSRSTTAQVTTSPRNRFLLIAGMLLFLVCGPWLLWRQFGFAQYAFTGLSWIHTQGTVTDSYTTYKPTIQFAARDGSPILFTEDYLQICGRRSFCFVRHFAPGQVVPIVYDPAKPERAYVYDWPLFAATIQWFMMAGFMLLIALAAYSWLVGTLANSRYSPDEAPMPDRFDA